jgi:5-methylcytosine-specific restriction endonuclease McrA
MKTNARPKASKKPLAGTKLESLVAFPFQCLNCDQPIKDPVLFCSEVCKQEAKFVRYVRACRRDERDQQPDIQEAIEIKLAMILGGGYPEKERHIPDSIRKAVTRHDKGRCKICGNPGDQIDHISGSSNDLKNLQLLCRDCHNQKTTADFVRITPETHPEEWAKVEALYYRIEITEPFRLCDSEVWENSWRSILSARRKAIQE